jgi:hypothetical protein
LPSSEEQRHPGLAWAALGQEEHKRIARLLCEAAGHDPDTFVHVEDMPLERRNSPDGVVLIYRGQDWAPMWRRYLLMAQRLYLAGILSSELGKTR